MSTKESIIQLADQLICDKGYNAFSFYDIAKTLGIKNASIHYYFPGKTQLGIAVIKQHGSRFNAIKTATACLPPVDKLQAFINSYSAARAEERICIVGSLASDLHTLEPAIEQELRQFALDVIEWMEQVLKEGLDAGTFGFTMPARTKALMIITNLLAALQLTRLTGAADFYIMAQTIMQELAAAPPK